MSTLASIEPLKHEATSQQLSEWQDGQSKPATDGPYFREFDEGEAVSWFLNGEWTRDGFFASDIQDARWRGLVAEPVQSSNGLAAWWALVMGAAASLEDAAACLRDEEAKRAAEGAAKHVRDKCHSLWAAASSSPDACSDQDSGRLDALEDLVKSMGLRGVSFDYARHVEDGYVTESGYRFMWRGKLGERKKTIRAAIDSATGEQS
jgi:hypothetical protein